MIKDRTRLNCTSQLYASTVHLNCSKETHPAHCCHSKRRPRHKDRSPTTGRDHHRNSVFGDGASAVLITKVPTSRPRKDRQKWLLHNKRQNATKTITTYGVHKCRVFVEEMRDKPTNLRYGVKGAILQKSTKPSPVSTKTASAFEMFTAGPFAFEPSTKKLCSTRV
ncbi:hypothetical protein POM88_006501 [Heracleum sosnowskyi]|uniref:Uncharacterized protein n=1 Tax=Heracleum sosnowskyi TaxID=360622 RepID=A0AAD8J3T6_9APIA|nr:hypothetical protein POM88_006501 [Heracleum sosnowskyi]